MTLSGSFRFPRLLCVVVTVLGFAGFGNPAQAQFETRANQAVMGESFSIVAGDFNRDGRLDVAVPAGFDLWILLGNGDGTFTPFVSYPGAFYPIAVADFNNDGVLDLAVGPLSNSISVFLGNGDGTFQPPKSSSTYRPRVYGK